MALPTILCGIILVSATLPVANPAPSTSTTTATTTTTTDPKTTTSSICGQNYLSASETPKLLSSSDYPPNLEKGLMCSWTIEAKETEKIRVTVLICDKTGDGDKLRIFDGTGPRDQKMGDVCAGKSKPEIFTSTGRYMRIEFNTSNKGTFKLTYNSGNYHVGRHEDIFSGYGATISPLAQTRENIKNVDLSWRLRNRASNIDIRMNLSHFQYSEGCVTDYIEVFDGYRESDTSLGKWCEGDISFFSSGDYLFIKFHSDINSDGSSFEIEYAFLYVCRFVSVLGPTISRHPIVVGVVVGVLALAILIIICVCVRRRRKRSNSNASAEKGTVKGTEKDSDPSFAVGTTGLPPSYDHAIASGPPTYQSLSINPDDKLAVL
ncbi:bone morphogenetic protein 1-like isoform X2 [Haliotis cracherodii]|uniref:bone morphogenetic protein 1-like isoform X2 n=1 Tax=Haliotis cracherodii TaxID=6455 RepID=UPI0039EACD4A